MVDDQVGLPRHAGGWHPALLQQRSPVPDRPRLEVRHRHRVRWALAATPPDGQQRADGRGRVRRAAQGVSRLSARISLRHDPRRRKPRHLPIPATRPRTCPRPSVPPAPCPPAAPPPTPHHPSPPPPPPPP